MGDFDMNAYIPIILRAIFYIGSLFFLTMISNLAHSQSIRSGLFPIGQDTFKQIANEGHYVIRTYSGEVLTAASNSKGQLGVGDTINRNHLVDTGLTDIFDIAVGKDHTLFLTGRGEVYFAGRNKVAAQPAAGGNPVDYFISGTWNFVDDEMVYPTQVFQGFYPLDDIRSIQAGDYKSFAMDANGRAYGWGYAHFGEFGRGTHDYELFPRVMPIPEPVKAVASDAYHTLFLTVGGEVYAAGRKAYGILGNGDGILNGQIDYASVAAPVKIPGLNHVAAIATTNLASFALHNDGMVSAWGKIPAAQCSEYPTGLFKGIQRTPVNLSQCLATTNGNTNLMDIVKIDGGDGHIIALNDAGEVYTMGNNLYGQLGRNGAQHVPLPVNFNGFLIDNVSAGGHTSLAEACDNIWIFGKETWSSENLLPLGRRIFYFRKFLLNGFQGFQQFYQAI